MTSHLLVKHNQMIHINANHMPQQSMKFLTHAITCTMVTSTRKTRLQLQNPRD